MFAMDSRCVRMGWLHRVRLEWFPDSGVVTHTHVSLLAPCYLIIELRLTCL